MLLVQSACRATCTGVVHPINQTVSSFLQSIACRKEGNSVSNRNPYNLSVFNSLRRVLTATGLKGCAPLSHTRVSAPIGATLAPKAPRNRVTARRFLLLIHTGEFPPAGAVLQRAPAKSLPQSRLPWPRR